MTRALFVVVAAVVLGIVLASVAHAQSNCGNRDAIAAQLDAQFGEHVVAVGLNDGGRVVEVFASENGETWTMILTSPGGTACMFATGEFWQPLEWAATPSGSSF